jgi:hypothetical protein
MFHMGTHPTMELTTELLSDSRHFHAVRFYEHGQSLARIVARFIAEGPALGEAAIIIATPEHLRGILEAAATSIDVEALTSRGDLIALDVNAALEAFMVDEMPAPKLFSEAVLPMIEKARAGRQESMVRVYGEMADLLWSRGQMEAALRLEMLGSQLADAQRVSILCGYSMGNCFAPALFERICREHTHVMSADGGAAVIGSGGMI